MRFFLLSVFVTLSVWGYAQDSVSLFEQVDFIRNSLDVKDCSWNNNRLDFAFEQIIHASPKRYAIEERSVLANDFVRIAGLLMQWDSPEAALMFLQRAKEFDPNNSDAILLKSKIYASVRDYDKAYSCLVRAYSRISSMQYSHALQLSRSMALYYGVRAREMYSQGFVQQAFDYVSKLDTLTMLYPIHLDNYNALMDSIISRLQMKYFQNLDRSLGRGNYDSALIWLHKVTWLMSDYIWFTDSLTLVGQRQRIKNLMVRFVENGLSKGDIDAVVSAMDNFSSLCGTFPDRDCPYLLDSLRGMVYEQNYVLLLKRLRRAIRRQDFVEAQEDLKSIEKYINDYDIHDTGEYYRLRDTLLRLVVNQKIMIVRRFTQKNEYDSALVALDNLMTSSELRSFEPDSLSDYSRKIKRRYALYLLTSLHVQRNDILKAEQIILKSGLVADTLIMNRLYNALARLGKDCKIKHEKFFQTLGQVHLVLLDRDFLRASKMLSDLLKLNDSQCPLPVDTLGELRNYISPMVAYQMLFNDMMAEYTAHHFERCLDGIMAVTSFYYDKNLKKYGTEPPDLFKIITSFGEAFVFVAIKRFIAEDSLDMAYKLLQYLHSQSVPSFSTRDIQRELGYRLAVRDFSLDPYEKRYKALRRYYGKHSWWYRYMLWAYYRQRTKMKAFRF